MMERRVPARLKLNCSKSGQHKQYFVKKIILLQWRDLWLMVSRIFLHFFFYCSNFFNFFIFKKIICRGWSWHNLSLQILFLEASDSKTCHGKCIYRGGHITCSCKQLFVAVIVANAILPTPKTFSVVVIILKFIQRFKIQYNKK